MDVDGFYREIGRRIATRRGALPLTQEKLGERVGLSRASVSNIERGDQRLLAHQLFTFAQALELPGVQPLLPDNIHLEEQAVPDEGTFSFTGDVDALSADARKAIGALLRGTGSK